MNVISFIKRALQGGSGGAVRVADDQPLPVYLAFPPVGSTGMAGDYETVAAGATAQVLGTTGATGDYLARVILQPAAAAAGTTTILDNATVIYTYTAGTLVDLKPIVIEIGAFSVSGAWKITTGTSMAALAVGNFT